MEDQIAREGTLARCNQDREATVNDIECANARRAAAAIALREERERRRAFEVESERKIKALRLEHERELEIARAAQAEAEAAAKAAYDAFWASQNRAKGTGQDAVGAAAPPIAGEESAEPAAEP